MHRKLPSVQRDPNPTRGSHFQHRQPAAQLPTSGLYRSILITLLPVEFIIESLHTSSTSQFLFSCQWLTGAALLRLVRRACCDRHPSAPQERKSFVVCRSIETLRSLARSTLLSNGAAACTVKLHVNDLSNQRHRP